MPENKTLYHFNRHYVNNPLPFGSIDLLQIGRRYCKATEIISAHPHLNWFELTIVTGGKGVVITNDVETQMQSGDIYLSFPCDVHEIRADEKENLEYDFFSFACNDTALQQDLKNITHNYWGSESRIIRDEKISDLVQCAIAEFLVENQPYSKQLLTELFHLILIYLIRAFNDSKQNAAHISQSEILCFQLMNYIDTHIYSLQKLDELAPQFNYNYGYLSGLFKRTTGKTISEYYNHRKMETAKALILEKKKKISEIAEMLGYNLYSFSKAFKSKYGISPKNLQGRNSKLS